MPSCIMHEHPQKLQSCTKRLETAQPYHAIWRHRIQHNHATVPKTNKFINHTLMQCIQWYAIVICEGAFTYLALLRMASYTVSLTWYFLYQLQGNLFSILAPHSSNLLRVFLLPTQLRGFFHHLLSFNNILTELDIFLQLGSATLREQTELP
jgi:hypothetical protein